jgi:aspartyl-tRNA(Asn)/glutamyl-tRNA(Gln) amidotransferase subunit C
LAGIDTDGVEPLYTVLDVRNVLREDINAKTVAREDLLAGAPMQYDGFFQVPKAL